jgi:hypothetical protein
MTLLFGNKIKWDAMVIKKMFWKFLSGVLAKALKTVTLNPSLLQVFIPMKTNYHALHYGPVLTQLKICHY